MNAAQDSQIGENTITVYVIDRKMATVGRRNTASERPLTLLLWNYKERPCLMLENKSKSYRFALTLYPYSKTVPYSRGGRSEAQQNALRQGSALP